MPIRPSSPIFFTVSNGKSWVSSIFAAIGRTSLSAKSRTISRTARCCSSRSNEGPVCRAIVSGFIAGASARVIVEAAAALAAEVAGLDHLAQQRARTVLRIAQPFVQDLHDAEAGVETDEVGERERTERM